MVAWYATVFLMIWGCNCEHEGDSMKFDPVYNIEGLGEFTVKTISVNIVLYLYNCYVNIIP